MSFNNGEKARIMNAAYKTDGAVDNLYIALGSDDSTELLAANGYSRGVVPASERTIANNGTMTITAGLEIYTASGAGAEVATHMRISRGRTSNSQWLGGWMPLTGGALAAPADGQAVETGVITITP